MLSLKERAEMRRWSKAQLHCRELECVPAEFVRHVETGPVLQTYKIGRVRIERFEQHLRIHSPARHPAYGEADWNRLYRANPNIALASDEQAYWLSYHAPLTLIPLLAQYDAAPYLLHTEMAVRKTVVAMERLLTIGERRFQQICEGIIAAINDLLPTPVMREMRLRISNLLIDLLDKDMKRLQGILDTPLTEEEQAALKLLEKGGHAVAFVSKAECSSVSPAYISKLGTAHMKDLSSGRKL